MAKSFPTGVVDWNSAITYDDAIQRIIIADGPSAEEVTEILAIEVRNDSSWEDDAVDGFTVRLSSLDKAEIWRQYVAYVE